MLDAQFSRAIGIIYQAASNPDLWPKALEAISSCFDDFGAILLYNRDDGAYNAMASPNLKETVLEYVQAGWNFRDTRALRSRELGYFLNRDAITDRDVISEDEMTNDPFYTEFLARHGLKYFAAAMVSPNRHIEVALSLQRSLGKPRYSDEELASLQLIGTHVEQALRLSVQLMDGDMLTAGLIGAFERMNIGVFALDTLTRVLFANSIASGLVGDGFEIVDDKLQFRQMQPVGTKKTPRLISSDDQFRFLTVETRPILVDRKSAQQPLVVYVMPLHPQNHAATFLVRAHTIVMVMSSDVGDAPDPSLLRDVLGLTLGEARVASLVGTGWPPRSAAEKLGISEETARTVLKRVYSKVGVGRQSELTGLIARLHLGVSGPSTPRLT